MTNSTPEPEQEHDQDAEPTLNAPEEGRPDGAEVSAEDAGDQQHTT